MKISDKTISFFLVLLNFFLLPNSQAAEFSAHGIVDFRISHVNSLEKSYLEGGYGKFALGDGLQFSLAQAGTDWARISHGDVGTAWGAPG